MIHLDVHLEDPAWPRSSGRQFNRIELPYVSLPDPGRLRRATFAQLTFV